MNEKNKYINMAATRHDDQRDVYKKILHEGHCPFCRENLYTYHKKPILHEGNFWLVTENQWPYEKVRHQVLAIYKTHIEHISDMDEGAGEELFRFFKEEARKRNIPGGGCAMRFGTSNEGSYGSTVHHLHAHLIEPDLAALDSNEAWRFKFGQPEKYKK